MVVGEEPTQGTEKVAFKLGPQGQKELAPWEGGTRTIQADRLADAKALSVPGSGRTPVWEVTSWRRAWDEAKEEDKCQVHNMLYFVGCMRLACK